MIILINGPSSSGKTTLAKHLHPRIQGPVIVYARDHFHQMLPEEFWTDADLRKAHGPQLFRAFHQSVAAMARTGVTVIVDHVLNQPEWPSDIAKIFSDIPTLLVGLHCPIDVLEERERARADRELGLAKSQIDIVHTSMVYDLEFDSSRTDPEIASSLIAERYERGDFQALKQLGFN